MNYIDELAQAVRRALPAKLLPDEDRIDDLCRIYALLVLTRGEEMTANDVHDGWATWMAMTDSRHDSLRPFGELDAETRREDTPFLEALQWVARQRT